LADRAETAVKRGRKRRAKTDRADSDLQLRLLLAGELPTSWIPPAQILELLLRVCGCARRSSTKRTACSSGCKRSCSISSAGRAEAEHPRRSRGVGEPRTSPTGRELVALALRMCDGIDRELRRGGPLLRWLN